MEALLKEYQRSFFESILNGKNTETFYLLFHTGERCGHCVVVLDLIEELPDKARGKIVSVPRGNDIWVGLVARLRIKDYPTMVLIDADLAINKYQGKELHDLLNKWKIEGV